MAEPQPHGAETDVRASLHTIAQVLRETKHFTPETQQALAELVDELGRAVESGAASSQEVAHLAESVAHVAQALREQRETGPLKAARKRLERAIGFAEGKRPFSPALPGDCLTRSRNLVSEAWREIYV